MAYSCCRTVCALHQSRLVTHTLTQPPAAWHVYALQVQFAGEEYNLRVLQLEPGPAVSVIDTDIAADVGPSIETEGYLRAQAEAAAREAEMQRQQQEQAEREAAAVSMRRLSV